MKMFLKSFSARLCLGLLSVALPSLVWAQAPLISYERAKTALQRSVAALPDDSVASLDALRRAKSAFAPLAEGLEPPLRQGLQATFERAEQAIVNASQTDLSVQAAVLRGGFQRSLYESALESAGAGELPQAKALLKVLGSDLQLTPTGLSGDARALQLSFERRLAARSLMRLSTLTTPPPEGRGARYETLAQLYGYIFLVQDSPRLPASAQRTVLSAIQALIAGRPLEPALGTLKTELQTFGAAAQAAQARLAAPPAEQGANVPSAPPTPGAPAKEQDRSGAAETTSRAPDEPIMQTPPPVPETTPEQLVPADTPPATAPPTDPLSFLGGAARTYLLIAAGLLALVALVQIVSRRTPFPSPLQRAATALLLLPALAEGLITLALTLAPLLGQPVLAQAQRFSLFRSPVTQLVWALLVAGAVFCLAFSRRVPQTQERAVAATVPATAPVAVAAKRTSTPPATQTRAPLATGGFDWDEDF